MTQESPRILIYYLRDICINVSNMLEILRERYTRKQEVYKLLSLPLIDSKWVDHREGPLKRFDTLPLGS